MKGSCPGYLFYHKSNIFSHPILNQIFLLKIILAIIKNKKKIFTSSKNKIKMLQVYKGIPNHLINNFLQATNWAYLYYL